MGGGFEGCMVVVVAARVWFVGFTVLFVVVREETRLGYGGLSELWFNVCTYGCCWIGERLFVRCWGREIKTCCCKLCYWRLPQRTDWWDVGESFIVDRVFLLRRITDMMMLIEEDDTWCHLFCVFNKKRICGFVREKRKVGEGYVWWVRREVQVTDFSRWW